MKKTRNQFSNKLIVIYLILSLTILSTHYTFLYSGERKLKEKYTHKVIINLPIGKQKGEFWSIPKGYHETHDIHLSGGFTLDQEGNIYLGDSTNQRILKANDNGKFIKQLKVGVEFEFLAVDKQNNLYVSWTERIEGKKVRFNHYVNKYNQEGKPIKTFPSWHKVVNDAWNNIFVLIEGTEHNIDGYLYNPYTDQHKFKDIIKIKEDGQKYKEYVNNLDKEGNGYVVEGGYERYVNKNINPIGKYYEPRPVIVKVYNPDRKLNREIILEDTTEFLLSSIMFGIDKYDNLYFLGMSEENREMLSKDYRKVERENDLMVKFDKNGKVIALIKIAVKYYPIEYRFFVDKEGNIYHINLKGYSGGDDERKEGFKIIKYEMTK